MPAAEPVEISVIRQSFRCFWFGAVGLIPGLGISLAWQAIELFHQIRRSSGDHSRPAFPIALLITATLVNPLLQLGIGWAAALVATFFLALVFLAWTFARFHQTSTERWNPARHWAWAGATFGGLGLAFSLLLLQAAYINAYFGGLYSLR